MKTLIIFVVLGLALWYGYTNFISNNGELRNRDSAYPAAGACDFQEGNTVTAVINEDVPSPRCIKVRPDQNLRVENNTLKDLSVGFDNISSRILFPSKIDLRPDSKYIFAKKFGEYLESGVHRLTASPYSGPEIWLVVE